MKRVKLTKAQQRMVDKINRSGGIKMFFTHGPYGGRRWVMTILDEQPFSSGNWLVSHFLVSRERAMVQRMMDMGVFQRCPPSDPNQVQRSRKTFLLRLKKAYQVQADPEQKLPAAKPLHPIRLTQAQKRVLGKIQQGDDQAVASRDWSEKGPAWLFTYRSPESDVGFQEFTPTEGRIIEHLVKRGVFRVGLPDLYKMRGQYRILHLKKAYRADGGK